MRAKIFVLKETGKTINNGSFVIFQAFNTTVRYVKYFLQLCNLLIVLCRVESIQGVSDCKVNTDTYM